MYLEAGQNLKVSSELLQQIGIDICIPPEVDGLKHSVGCINYFSKWLDAKPIKNKRAPIITQFLYEIICRHKCMKIQIKYQ